MFVKNKFYKIYSTLLIVIIGVHFVKSLDEVTEKTPNEKQPTKNNGTTNKIEAEASYRRTRVLADFPSPVYVPLEAKKKTIKYKRKYTEDDDEVEDNDEESGGKGSKKYQNSYYSNPMQYKKPVIKYVPIPVYLSAPKPKTSSGTPSPYTSLSIEDLMAINMGINDMMTNTGANGYSPMEMNSGLQMPINYGTGYNMMGMNGGGPASYNSQQMTGGYGSMGNTGGNQNQNVNSGNGYGSTNCPSSMKNYNTNGCDSNNGNPNSGNYGNNQMGQYTNQGSTKNDYGYNNNINYSGNQSSNQKPNTNSKTSRKSKKPSTTTTTTEQPAYDSNTEISNESDRDAKAKQIAKMLEMLDKWS